MDIAEFLRDSAIADNQKSIAIALASNPCTTPPLIVLLMLSVCSAREGTCSSPSQSAQQQPILAPPGIPEEILSLLNLSKGPTWVKEAEEVEED